VLLDMGQELSLKMDSLQRNLAAALSTKEFSHAKYDKCVMYPDRL